MGSQAWSSGHGRVDLRGTPFRVAPGAFVTGGHLAAGDAMYSAEDQVVTLTGGGNCGATQAIGERLRLAFLPVCGDGVIEGSEGCDDGNAEDDEACPATCRCGDAELGRYRDCPASTCEALVGVAGAADGVYWLDPDDSGQPFEASCDLTTEGGGWTLLMRLNSNDLETRDWDADFWTSTDEIGALTGNLDDYLSPAYDRPSGFGEILLDYRYTAGQQKRMAALFSGTSQGTFRHHTTRPLSNTNPLWLQDHTLSEPDPGVAAGWYGPGLRFQTVGNESEELGGDNYRIWYNQVSVEQCNQAGGIGGWGDNGRWYYEQSFPSATPSCQENTHRGMIGTNGGGYLMEEELLSPADAYEEGIMYVFVR